MDSFKIRELFIFNTKLKSPKKKPSDDEAQDAKLLYYYPENTEVLVKRSNIGIIEGTLSFMQSFEDVNSNFLFTELNKTYFVADGYEDDFIIGFILDKENVKAFNKFENLDTKKKWFKELLDNFYDSFILFHNKFFEFFLNKENPYVNLGMSKEKNFMLNDFIKNYFIFIENMKLPMINNFQYFTMNTNLESELLLAIQRLTEKMPNLKMTTIMYKGKIVHNQLPINAMSILYNIFFSSFECTQKYSKFSKPVFKQITIENPQEENKEIKNRPNENKNLREEKIEEKTEETKENEIIQIEEKEEKTEESKKNEVIKMEEKEEKEENKDNEKNKEEINNEEKEKEETKVKEEINGDENNNKIQEKNEDTKNEETEKKEDNEIKEENLTPSSYRKVLAIKNVQSQFLTGVLKDNETENNYNIFVPKIYIKENNSEYSMIIYLTKGILFFLFFDNNFVVEKEIDKISKIGVRINKYFKAQFDNIIKLERPIIDTNIYFYKNENDNSIKFSGFIKKNNNLFDWKLYENLQKAFFINGDSKLTSIAKYKGYYIYYINSIGQKVAMLFKDNLTLTQLKQEIEKIKKTQFDHLFLN